MRLLTETERRERDLCSAVTGIVGALADVDPGRAERLAQSIADIGQRNSALSTLAITLAATDPDRAERIAQSVTDEGKRDSALSKIAVALADTDPDRAERLGRSLAGHASVGRIVEALVPVHSDHAERVVQAIPKEKHGDYRLQEDVIAVLAERSADQAESLAKGLVYVTDRAAALRRLAVMHAQTDPDRAKRLAMSIPDPAEVAVALVAVARALADSAPDLAGALVNDAESAVQSIAYDSTRISALARLAEALR